MRAGQVTTSDDSLRPAPREHGSADERPSAARTPVARDPARRLYALTVALAGALDERAVGRAFTEHGVSALGALAGVVCLVAGDGLVLTAWSGYRAETIAGWERIPLSASIPLTDAVRAESMVVVASSRDYAARYPGLRDRGGGELRPTISLPLMVEGRCIGVCGLSFAADIALAAEDRDLLASLAALCSQALHRARLYESEQRARRLAEEALVREQRMRGELDAFLSFTPIGLALFDADLRYVRANAALAAHHGRPAAELIGRTVHEVLPQAPTVALALRESFDWDQPLINVAVSARVAYRNEEQLREFLSSYFPVPLGDGRRGVGAAVTDVTELRRAQRAIEASEAHFRAVCELIPQIAWSALPDGRHDYVNARWTEATGLPREAAHGRGWLAVVHPDDVERALASWTDAVARGIAVDLEYRMRSVEGQWRWTLLRAAPLHDADGLVARWFGTCTDIEDRKRAETELGEARARAERSADHLSRLQRVTAALAATRSVQAIADEVVGHVRAAASAAGVALAVLDADGAAFEIVAAEGSAAAMPRVVPVKSQGILVEACRIGEPLWVASQDELRARWPASPVGRVVEGCVAALPLRGEARVLGVLVLGFARGRELTQEDREFLRAVATQIGQALDRARLDESERAARAEAEQAVAARDAFLSMAAHDLRTPLTTLRLLTGNLLRTPDAPAARVQPQIASIDRQIGRMTRLIEMLLDVSRIVAGRLVLELEDLDAAEVVRDVASQLEDEARRAGCALEVRAAPGIVGRWDRLRLEQIVMNLLANALKYGARAPVQVAVWREGDGLVLTVRDGGIGIAEADLERIFHRFERAVSGRSFAGLGIGLWIVAHMSEALGGSVSVESRLGQGSTFTVRLPLRSPPSWPPPP